MIQDTNTHSINESGSNSVNIEGARLWKTLDDIAGKLTDIEAQMIQVVRLEEKVASHSITLARYGVKIDDCEGRLHEGELWQARQGNYSHHGTKLEELERLVEEVKSGQSRNAGQKDILSQVVKYILAIFVTWIAFEIASRDDPKVPTERPAYESKRGTQ